MKLGTETALVMVEEEEVVVAGATSTLEEDLEIPPGTAAKPEPEPEAEVGPPLSRHTLSSFFPLGKSKYTI